MAEIAATTHCAFGLDDVPENPVIKAGLGIVFIAIMTHISYCGIVISQRVQAVLSAFQFIVLVVMSVIALVRVYSGSAGPQAVHPGAFLVLPLRARRIGDRGRSDLVNLHLLRLGFLPDSNRGDQGRRQNPRSGGVDQHGNLDLYLLDRRGRPMSPGGGQSKIRCEVNLRTVQ